MELLAERELPGYPGATVELQTDGKRHAVSVKDQAGGKFLGQTESRLIAKDMYFHPFVYGYNYTNIERGEEDGS